jgi:hypothetical protein
MGVKSPWRGVVPEIEKQVQHFVDEDSRAAVDFRKAGESLIHQLQARIIKPAQGIPP